MLLLGGDFRQVLPVLPRANATQIVRATVKHCTLWSQFMQMKLRVNMRASPAARDFAAWLLQVGEGTLGQPGKEMTDQVTLPPPMLIREQCSPACCFWMCSSCCASDSTGCSTLLLYMNPDLLRPSEPS